MRTKFTLNKSSIQFSLKDLITEALITDGEHHKQWYLEQLLMKLGFDENDMEDIHDEYHWDTGIAP